MANIEYRYETPGTKGIQHFFEVMNTQFEILTCFRFHDI